MGIILIDFMIILLQFIIITFIYVCTIKVTQRIYFDWSHAVTKCQHDTLMCDKMKKKKKEKKKQETLLNESKD